MQMSQMHYLPIAPAFFAILVGALFIVLILRSVSYAYESLASVTTLRCGYSSLRSLAAFSTYRSRSCRRSR